MKLIQLTLVWLHLLLFVPLPDLWKLSDNEAKSIADKWWTDKVQDFDGWHGEARRIPDDKGECAVGISTTDGGTFYIFARGRTWEEAFLQARYVGH